MNKEEAIKIVRSHYPANKQMLNEALEFLIPELKESEDELTWLKNYISEEVYYLSMDIRDNKDSIKLQKLQKSLAWLEKQGADRNKEYWKGYREGKQEILDKHDALEKQGEQKPIERKDYISIPFGAFDSELIEETITIPDGYVATIEGNKIHIKKKDKSATEAVKEEKADNANKVEPKFEFKVGDWIVRKDGQNFCNGSKFAQITKIDGEKHWFDSGTWLRDEDIRLWSILDAKDGDVLVSSIDKPFIYNGCYNKYEVGAYCGLNINNEFTIAYKQYYWTNNDSIRPATKEERKTLFNEMNLLGWIWNPETKELNRLDKDGENCLRNIVNESIDKVNNGTATSHDAWVVKNIKFN